VFDAVVEVDFYVPLGPVKRMRGSASSLHSFSRGMEPASGPVA